MPLGPIETLRVFTGDLSRSRPFYENLLDLDLLVDDAGACLFDTGPAKLLLEQVDLEVSEERALVGRFAGFSFTVTDLSEVVRDLQAKGVPFAAPPEAQDWGGLLAHFSDPVGNVLTLVQYPDRRSSC